MMMKHVGAQGILLLMAAVIVISAEINSIKTQVPAFVIEMSDKNGAARYCDYILAELYMAQDAPGQSLGLLDELSSSHATDSKAHYFLNQARVRALSQAEQFSDVAQLDPSLLEQDTEAQLLFAQAYINEGKDKEAEELLTRLKKVHPLDEQIVYFFLIFLMKKDRTKEALDLLASFLRTSSNVARHAPFLFLQAKIFLDKGKMEEAQGALDKSLNLMPTFEKAWYLKAVIHQTQGQAGQAIDCYKKFLELSPHQAPIRKMLVGLLIVQERFDEAYAQLMHDSVDRDSYYFEQAWLLWKMKQYSQALEKVEATLAKNSNHVKAHALKIELLVRMHEIKEAYVFAREWLSKMPFDQEALKACISLKNHGVAFTEISDFLEEMVAKYHDRNTTVALGDLCFDVRAYEKAAEHYSTLRTRVHDEELSSKLLYQIAYCYFLARRLDKVEEPLKKALDSSEVYTPIYNLLAYYYSCVGRNLHSALDLVTLALKKEKDNSAFLDTKGCILLRLGKISQAASFFKKALLIAPNSKTIRYHFTLIQ